MLKSGEQDKDQIFKDALFEDAFECVRFYSLAAYRPIDYGLVGGKIKSCLEQIVLNSLILGGKVKLQIGSAPPPTYSSGKFVILLIML